MRVFVLCLGLILPLIGCKSSGTPEAKPVGALVVHEGLPHQSMEAELYAKEKARVPDALEWGGFRFYPKPLTIKEADLKAVRAAVSDKGTYAAFSGEKKCGGFHPDYAVSWGGGASRALICFGCNEVMLLDNGKSTRHDLGSSQGDVLERALRHYRVSRPQR